MTAYNREQYISEAIESVINSTLSDFELIIVDDCSVDSTLKIAKKYEAEDDRIRVYSNNSNIGDYNNRNKAAEKAKGKYLKYLDSDDIIYPHGLSVMVESMEQYPGASFGLSATSIEASPFPILLSSHKSYIRNYFESDLFGRAPGSGIINLEKFRKAGGFSGKQYVGDHELWLKLARYGSLVLFPRDLVWDRIHEGQQKKFDIDNPVEISFLHNNLEHIALSHPDCPLSPNEVDEVVLILNRKHFKSIFNILFKKRKLGMAIEYYNKLNLKFFGLFRFQLYIFNIIGRDK